ncbi:MAG: hypothetical protein V4631_15300 [Pseudomonadota bacterium]
MWQQLYRKFNKMKESVTYILLNPDEPAPACIGSERTPCPMVVIIEAVVSPQWQGIVSDRIEECGCLYMMAWGIECSSWDDSVDWAQLAAFDFGDIPEENFLLTTWHEEEPLSEVFDYAKTSANHPTMEIKRTILLHISTQDKSAELLHAYADNSADI